MLKIFVCKIFYFRHAFSYVTTIFGWEEEEIDSGLVFIVTIFKFYIIIVFFNL